MNTTSPITSSQRLNGWFLGVAFTLPGILSYAIDTSGLNDFRSADGSNNNQTHSEYGESHQPLIRIAPADYGDGTDLPRGVPVEDEGDGDVETDEQTLPSARSISNAVHDQNGLDLPSGRKLSQLFFQFGQFLSHDTGLTEPDSHVTTGGMTGLSGNESFNIEIAPGDPDLFATPFLSLSRSISLDTASSGTGLREQINTITAFIDGSNVYGSTLARANELRTFVGGKLKSQAGPDGELLPYNVNGFPNANQSMLSSNQLFLAGDVRANEQIGLIAMHTIFMREHNRLCNEIAASDFPGADLSNAVVDEVIYQRARATVAAMLQKITYYDWLPVLLGYDAMPYYKGYDPSVDPQISNEFSTAAFRIGHTMLPSTYQLTDGNGVKTPFALRDAFFNPPYVATNGIDKIVRGQALHIQQELDQYVVDDVRVFLFFPGSGVGLDLPALNLQRGRDHGIPSYNAVRVAYGLPALGQYSDIPTKGTTAITALQSAYGGAGVQNVDAWTGGLVEKHLPGTNLGETFTRVFVDQFSRLRDGDRYYFENSNIYPYSFTYEILNTNLVQIIQRNTGVDWDDMNEYSFFVPKYHPFQPDVKVGKKYSEASHRGDDTYNSSGAGQKIRVKAKRGKAKLFISIQNDGAYMNPIRVRTGSIGPDDYKAKFFDISSGRRNVTSALRTGRYMREPRPENFRQLKGKIVGRRLHYPPNRKRIICFHAESDADNLADDTGYIRIKF